MIRLTDEQCLVCFEGRRDVTVSQTEPQDYIVRYRKTSVKFLSRRVPFVINVVCPYYFFVDVKQLLPSWKEQDAIFCLWRLDDMMINNDHKIFPFNKEWKFMPLFSFNNLVRFYEFL